MELKDIRIGGKTIRGKNLKILKRICKKIDSYKKLDTKMDYVDRLSISFTFVDVTDQDEDSLDMYLRDYVMDSI